MGKRELVISCYGKLLIASCFTKALWPDFSGDTLETAIASFQNRNRRFGGLKETTETEGSDPQ